MIYYIILFVCVVFLTKTLIENKNKTKENFKTNFYSTLTTKQFLDFVKRDSIEDEGTYGTVFDDYSEIILLIHNVILGLYQNNYNLSTNQNQYKIPVTGLPTYQKSCGCCYAHAFTCILESWYFINEIIPSGGNNLIKLSIQQIIDCCTSNGYAKGCNGASFFNLIKYFNTPVHIAYNESYEYTSVEKVYNKEKGKEDCEDYTQLMEEAVHGMQFITIPSLKSLSIVSNSIIKNIDIIKKIIYLCGPIYISVYISIDKKKADAFRDYPYDESSGLPYAGIYYDYFPNEGDTDADDDHRHAMVLVGWGNDYWIIRNSYGYYDDKTGFGNYWGVNGSGYLYSHFDKCNLQNLGVIIEKRTCVPVSNISNINNISTYWFKSDIKESGIVFNGIAYRNDNTYKFLLEIKCTSNLIYYKNITSTQKFIEITDKRGKPLTDNLENYYTGDCNSKKQDDNGDLFYIKAVGIDVVETDNNKTLDPNTLNLGECIWHIKLSIVNPSTDQTITFSQIDIDWKNAEVEE